MSAASQFRNDLLNNYEFQEIIRNLLNGFRAVPSHLDSLIDFIFSKTEDGATFDQQSYDKGYDKGYDDDEDSVVCDDRYDEGYDNGYQAGLAKITEETDLQKAKKVYYGPDPL